MKCAKKIRLGRQYPKEANRLKAKHNKEYGVYVCAYCGHRHLTTNLSDEEQSGRNKLLYRTDKLP